MFRKKLIVTLVLVLSLALPAAAMAVTWNTPTLGPGGEAVQGSYSGHNHSGATWTPVCDGYGCHYFEAGMYVSCCSGSSYYAGNGYDLNSPRDYYFGGYPGTTATSKLQCGRNASGVGYQTITCYS